MIRIRDRHVAVIEFLLSGKSPGELLAAKQLDELADILEMVRHDPPAALAQTDPALYRTLRARVTELRIAGWSASLKTGDIHDTECRAVD